jgi:hypothetical protein
MKDKVGEHKQPFFLVGTFNLCGKAKYKYKYLSLIITSGVPRGGRFRGSIPPPPEIPKLWQSWAETVLKYQKLRKFYYAKWNFLDQNSAASRIPD